MAAYRDPVTGLPRASYDLWEERHGVMAFTCAAVYAGLMAASNFTEGFGQAGLTGTYRRAAAEVKAGMYRSLYRQELNSFAGMVTFEKNGTLDYVVARHVRPNCPGLSGEAWLAGSLPHLPQPSPPIPDAQDEPVACPLFFILKAGRAGVTIHVWRMSHYSIRRPAELARPPRSSGR